MIDCYTWMTDNGYKPRVMLEETGLPHKIIPVDLRVKAQMAPDFMKISPGHKIPAIVDHEGPGGAQVDVEGAEERLLRGAGGLDPRHHNEDRRPAPRRLHRHGPTNEGLQEQLDQQHPLGHLRRSDLVSGS